MPHHLLILFVILILAFVPPLLWPLSSVVVGPYIDPGHLCEVIRRSHLRDQFAFHHHFAHYITPSFILSSCLPLFPFRRLRLYYYRWSTSQILCHSQVRHLASINRSTHCRIFGELGPPCVSDSYHHCPILIPLLPSFYIDSVSLARVRTRRICLCHRDFSSTFVLGPSCLPLSPHHLTLFVL